MNKFKLKSGLPDKQYCDDPLFEFFEGNFLNPEKYLSEQIDINEVNKARQIILDYFKTLKNNHLLES